ncbi:MAG: PEPxxWA-CTERM sorting domain-containing protein [Sphingomonadaceae bacterium]
MALKHIALSASAVLALGIVAMPASAAEPVTCASYGTTVITGTTDCVGFYSGNVFSSSTANVTTQTNAVAALGGTFDGNFNSLFGFGSLSNGTSGARTIDFGTTFYGDTIIGMHFGNIAGPEGNVSVFYKFDFGSAGASSITFTDAKGLSNLYVYSDPGAVPEPAAWALMILGFGAVGGVLRRSKKTKFALTYA